MVKYASGAECGWREKWDASGGLGVAAGRVG